MVLAPRVYLEHSSALQQHVLQGTEDATSSFSGAKCERIVAEEAEEDFNNVLTGVEVLPQMVHNVDVSF